MSRIILAMVLTLVSGSAVASDYAVAGTYVDATILVKTTQLKSMMDAYPMTLIKWTKIWNKSHDYGLNELVQAEGFDSFADCTDKTGFKTSEQRFHSSTGNIIKTVMLYKGKDFLSGPRTTISPGSPESIVLEFACSWLAANR